MHSTSATPTSLHGHTAAAVLILTGIVAAAAVMFPVMFPGWGSIDAFIIVVGGIHAAPFWVAALFTRRATSRLAVIAAVFALISEAGLMAWAYSVLDNDAQAGLVYIFVTPVASAGIAGAAAIVSLLRRRRQPAG